MPVPDLYNNSTYQGNTITDKIQNRLAELNKANPFTFSNNVLNTVKDIGSLSVQPVNNTDNSSTLSVYYTGDTIQNKIQNRLNELNGQVNSFALPRTPQTVIKPPKIKTTTPEIKQGVLANYPQALKETAISGIKAIPKMFFPAITNFVKKSTGIIGESLAYAIDPLVREQYKTGNLEILPTVSKTSPTDMLKDTFAAGLEASIYKVIPSTLKISIVKRFGVGALQGVGFAVSQGIANDETPEQILDNAKTYGKYGAAIEVVAPYLLPLLKTELRNIPQGVKSAFKGLVQETSNVPVGMSIKKVEPKLEPSIKMPKVIREYLKNNYGDTGGMSEFEQKIINIVNKNKINQAEAKFIAETIIDTDISPGSSLREEASGEFIDFRDRDYKNELVIQQKAKNVIRELSKFSREVKQSFNQSKGVGEVKPLAQEAKIVWNANKEGGQLIGNKQIIRKPTIQDFKKDILPRTREGYYGSGSIEQQYKNMLAKEPNIAVSYIDKGNGWEVVKVDDISNINKTIDDAGAWAKRVNDFNSEEAIKHRAMFDSGGLNRDFLNQSKAVTNVLKKFKAEDLVKTHPVINLKNTVPITDIYGVKKVIPAGEALTPYELKGNKYLLKDGGEHVVSKNQYQNIKGQSTIAEGKPFAPELEGVEETILGKQPGDAKKAMKITKKAFADFEAGKITKEERNRILDTTNNIVPQDKSKFSQYQLPGGKNYKEILFNVPAEKKPIISASNIEIKKVTKPTDTYETYNISANGKKITDATYQKGTELTPERILEMKDYHAKTLNEEKRLVKFSSHAYKDEMDNYGWIRMNEHDSPKYGKVAFLEEIQHVKPKELGGIDDITLEQYNKLPNYMKGNEFYKSHLKRALKEAVDNNSEYLAWTTGEQQAARYNLAKELESIVWSSKEMNRAKDFPYWKQPEGGRSLTIVPKKAFDQRIDLVMDKSGKITASAKQEWVGKNLNDVIGKGISEKILAEPKGNLSGEGLNIGGEWAKNLYDKQVKNIVEDITGHKVEILDMGLNISKKEPTIYNVDRKSLTSDKSKKLNPSELKIGQDIFVPEESRDFYTILDIYGNNKVKVIERKWLKKYSDLAMKSSKTTGRPYTEELYRLADTVIKDLDFSPPLKSAGQQAIKITPEIRAKVKGEAPTLKQPSGASPFGKAKIGPMAGISAGATGVLATLAALKEKNKEANAKTYAKKIASVKIPTSKELVPGEMEYNVITKKMKYKPLPGELKPATLTVYNPEKEQTDDSPDTGGFSTKMEYGDVAVGNRNEYDKAKSKFLKDKTDTFIFIPELEKVKTPYGDGIFRVRDTMKITNDGKNMLDIFIPNAGSNTEKTVRNTPKATYAYLKI